MTALPPLPASAAPAAPAGGVAASSGASGATSGGFLAMLLAALPGAAPAAPAGQGPTTSVPTAPLTGLPVEPDGATAPQEDVDAEAEPSEGEGAAVVAPIAGSVAPAAVLATLPAPPAAVTEAVRLAEAPAATPVDVAAGVGDESGVRPQPLPAAGAPQAGPLAGSVTPEGQLPAADPTQPPGPSGPSDAGSDTGSASPELQAAPGRETDAAAAPGTPVATTPSPSTSASPGIDVSTMTPVQAVAPGAPTAPAPAATPTATPAAAAPPVADQVFGEVSRLVTRGDGTHRLTVTLTPEALGDVRVTLTVRNGEVTVDFAAGDEARRALLEGAPELRRLLELTGASESRVTVRDGSTASSNAGATAGQAYEGQGPTTSGRGADDARRDQDHHAGTREGENAMDGSHRGPGDTRLPHDPVRSTRAAGLDLSL